MVTKEPGGTPIGIEIRRLLMDPKNIDLAPEAELLLYMADRLQHLKGTIYPALQKGKIVLCDRYHESTLAYQGGGRKLDLTWLDPLAKKWIKEPDCIFWFDVTPEIAQERLEKRYRNNPDEKKNRLEMEQLEFYQRIRKAYQSMAKTRQGTIFPIAAEEGIDFVQDQVISVLEKNFPALLATS